MTEQKVKKGDKVSIEYTGTFDDGEVFDSNVRDGECVHPLAFIVGSGMVIPGFDKAIEGMIIGDAKKVKILAKDAYGEKNQDLIKTMPKPASFPPQAKEGMLIGVGPTQDQQIPALIVKLTDSEITLDLNHPLAGKNLNFDIKVLDIQEAGEFEDDECCCGEHEHDHEGHDHGHNSHPCGDNCKCEKEGKVKKNSKKE
ncbi:MAG: peptidylprolyl isomerase [Candidatus Pacearchaeota archaeon]|jgi:FKBP-type peptidyl-prolyl cis-trans isomerase 2